MWSPRARCWANRAPTASRFRSAGIHPLWHFFETFLAHEQIPPRAINTWLGHRSDRSMAAVYYRLSDADSQSFMAKVPFGTGEPAAEAGKEEV